MISRGILDNDAEGKTGVGTIYWMEIRLEGLIERYQWGLLEELDGRFNPHEKLKAYREAAAKANADRIAAEELAKKAALEKRTSEVKASPQLDAIIAEVLAADAKTVEQFLAGKDKALNALVGKVMGSAKKQQLTPDAFEINHLIRQRLSRPG